METDLGRFVGSCCGQMSGRCWADVSACKSATQRLQIGDPAFANLRFATPKTCPKSARNLPRRLVKYLSGADLYRQARWKLIWADVCAAVAGRCWPELSACKSATQCLQIGDPMFANRRPILDNKPCVQMFESVELSICNGTCKSLQLLLQIFATPTICPNSARNLPW